MTFTTTFLLIVLIFMISGSEAASVRIINGSTAKPGEFPYMVSLRILALDDVEVHWCGGTILSEYFILTAGHCLHDNLTYARVGQVNLDDLSTNHNNSYAIKTTYLHPDYFLDLNSVNDLALIQLVTPLTFTDNVQSVQLPEVNASVPFGQQCQVAGWGMVNQTLFEPSNVLLKVDLIVFPDIYCEFCLGEDYLVNQNICAGDALNTKGHCSGDSGGPLVVSGIQWGIVSWSLKPCLSAPGVYTNLANPNYRNWIREITGI